ncbi:MAG: desulfoferrodoxin [Methanomassiliicoccaceae archaeon]|nr:desulfoferrodoxin [Methanomassiliicoccaceae archaeon]
MTNRRDIYTCALCGNTVEVEIEGKGKLSCCGQEMKLEEPRTADAATEKHVPIVEKKGNGVSVKVGSTAHPMNDDHYIAYIEICDDGVQRRKYLEPGMAPEAFFEGASEKAAAKEYCNRHGLWRS